jgi:N-acetylglucosaminyldiphosphoundecaprenol N-acetyl-beta-D-mannosaminyltransferase
MIAGLPIAASSPSEAVAKLGAWANAGRAGDVHLLNAYSIALAETDEAYRNCLLNSLCNFPDGKPLTWASKFADRRLSQVRGPRLFEATMEAGRSLKLRHFLLGATQETLDLLKDSLESRYPGVEIVGLESPPFRPLTDDERKQQDVTIRETNPHIVWVGLGTPKQDLEASRLAREAGFLAVAVGAAFDFSAGTKREAPAWMSPLGLEWVFRLATEPRRLWRRYLFGNVGFVRAVIRSLIRR